MKKLLIALVATVAVSTGFAKLTDTQSFETSFGDFVPSVVDEDASELVAYDSDAPAFPAPYNFENFGSKYLSLDTGDATLWRTNAGDAAYFDMAMQFNPSASAPEIDEDTKIAVYLNSSNNLVVLAGDGAGGTSTNETETMLVPGTWARLTIESLNNQFKVILNTNTVVGTYFSRKSDATIKFVGFKGTGALDDFVARTTDPFIQNPAVTIGGEGYASLADALADDPTATPQLETDTSLATPLAYGESISVKLNGHTLSGITTGSLIALESTSGDVTTYTAGYFPRTATAGQDGSAANPYEIADADDLVALQDAVIADAAFRTNSYVQTANIDMTGTTGFYGIGWFTSSDSYQSLPAGVANKATILFAGVYDGAGYTLSNVTLVRHNYAGVFNNVSGTVKNLTVQNLGFNDTSAGEWGCAIVGNAQGSALLENLTSAGTVWGNTANHNVAGTVVRVQNTVTIRGCVNNAPITSVSRRLGGIVSFTGNTAPTGTITIEGCTNNAALTVNTGSNAGDRGVGGIISRPESIADGLVISNCANFGVLTNNGVPTKVGGIAGELNSQNYVDGGGNTFLASLGPVGNYNSKTVTGLAYALPVTIDAVDYLTTVKQADLAAGNTYTLVANVGAGTVYTFDAAGTIAFNTNGYNFAGTVAADSTLGVVGPAVSGSVLSYSAGVAVVNGVVYPTFADALADVSSAPEGYQYVELLADASTTFSEVGSIAVKLDGHTFTVDYGAYAGSDSFDSSTGITTYTAAAVVATVGSDKFATLQSAIDAAVVGATKTVNLVGAATGAVNIPAGITVEASSSASLAPGVTALSGSGVLSVSGIGAHSSVLYPSDALFGASDWEGTVAIDNLDFTTDGLGYYGNSNSTVRLSNITVYGGLHAGNNNVKALEITGGGLTYGGLDGIYDTFPCALKGDGPITVTATPDTQYTISFTGDVSEYTGSITLANSGKARVVFGTTDIEGNGNCMVIGSDATVTVAAGKTWTAPGGFVVKGALVVNGALAPSTASLYGAGGTVTFTSSSGTIPFGQYWTGTYNANFNSGNGDYAFYLPISAGATTVINGANDTFCGYPKYGTGAPTVAGAIVLNANWVSSNGYSTATTTFAKLSGTGDLIVEGTDSQYGKGNNIPYTITELDNYTGTLGGRAGAFTIGKVNVATQPTSGTRVVKTAKGANGAINDNVPLYVGGVDTGKTLTYDAVGADGEGLYYYEPVVTYTITLNANGGTVDPASTNYTAETAAFDLPIAVKLGATFLGWTNETITVAFTNFVPGTTAALGDITLYAKWETSGNPQTIDPASETPTATFAAESEADAKQKVSLVTPAGVDAAEYKANFDFSATSNGDGTYTVTLTGIKDDVTDDVSEDAVAVLTSATGTGTVDVPAGLHYRITRYTAIGTPVVEQPLTGQSDGNGVSVSKPGSTQGFIKVEMSTVPFAVPNP